MNRRGFLKTCLILGAAPAIVRADSLMRIIPQETSIYLPGSAPLIIVPMREVVIFASRAAHKLESELIGRQLILSLLPMGMKPHNLTWHVDRECYEAPRGLGRQEHRLFVTAVYEQHVPQVQSDE